MLERRRERIGRMWFRLAVNSKIRQKVRHNLKDSPSLAVVRCNHADQMERASCLPPADQPKAGRRLFDRWKRFLLLREQDQRLFWWTVV